MKVRQEPPSPECFESLFSPKSNRSRQGWSVWPLQTGKEFIDSFPSLPTSIAQILTSCSLNGSVCIRNMQRNCLTTAMPSGASALQSPLASPLSSPPTSPLSSPPSSPPASPPASPKVAGRPAILEHVNTFPDPSPIDAQPMANLTLSDSTHPRSTLSTLT